MKKITSLLLVIIMAISVFALTGCPNNPPQPPAPGLNDKSEGVMTWAEYDAAAMDAPVVIEAYVQGHQSWWDNKVTVYLQDLDGGYFAYELACSEEDAAKLTPGTKIRITGYKTAWAGEVEIVDATFEFVNDGLTYVAEPKDVTSLIASDELVKQLVANGQIATQYVDLEGNATSDIRYNPNDSTFAIEGITSPDGRVFGKMGHSERIGNGLYKNVLGEFDMKRFESAVKYFK